MGSGRFGGARETQNTSFEITATPFGVGNYSLRLPYGTKGLAEKIYNVSPDYLFKPKDECTQTNHVAADEDYVQSLTSGNFTPEYTWWLRQWFPFVYDSRFVKGRDWRPVPAGVQENMQATKSTTQEGAGEEEEYDHDVTLKDVVLFAPRELQGDNKCLVMKALEMHCNEPLQHLIPKLGWSDQHVHSKDEKGDRKGAHRVFYKDGTSGRKYVRLTDTARDQVRERFGKQKVPRSRTSCTYNDLAAPKEALEPTNILG